MKELLLGLLTKTLNKSEQEITDLLYKKDGDELVLKEGVIDEVPLLDSARVESIKANAPVPKDRLDNEFKRGQKDTMEGLEKNLKEKYSFESEKKGVELIDEVLLKQSKASKMSDDDVKKHPLYLDLESNRIDKVAHEKLVNEYKDYKDGIEKQGKFSSIKDKAASMLDEMKPIVSENPSVAKTRREDFLAKFESFDYQVEGENIIVLKSDGSRLEDGHGNPLPFNNHVKNVAMLNYDFPKQSDKGNSGGDDNGNTNFHVSLAKSESEYVTMMREAKTGEERIAIQEANPDFSKL